MVIVYVIEDAFVNVWFVGDAVIVKSGGGVTMIETPVEPNIDPLLPMMRMLYPWAGVDLEVWIVMSEVPFTPGETTTVVGLSDTLNGLDNA